MVQHLAAVTCKLQRHLPVKGVTTPIYIPTRRVCAPERFHLRSNAIAWGNEPMSTTIYSGVVLLLEVGACVCQYTVAHSGMLVEQGAFP